ncbi:hypothetical protein BVY01_01130 [bacterium I07]|nr:hypothetical protein BVY01_01130 [bacterium I07]
MNDLFPLKFDQNGLIPAVVQDFHTRQVLMVAYMNQESLEITIEESRTCFYSRSRQTLWRKGETSGHVQQVREVWIDCDKDCILVLVDQTGPACHTGEKTCFFRQIPTNKKGR